MSNVISGCHQWFHVIGVLHQTVLQVTSYASEVMFAVLLVQTVH